MKNSKKPDFNIDFSSKNPKTIAKQLRKQEIPREKIGTLLKSADAVSSEAVYAYTRGLISTQTSKEQFLEELTPLFEQGLTMKSSTRKMMFSAVIEETGRAGSLFVIQNISGLKQKDARSTMADFMEAGGTMPDVAEWLQYAGQVLRKSKAKSSDTAGIIVDALGDAVEWLVDAIEDSVDAIINAIDAIIDAATSIGAALVELFEEVVAWTAEQIGNLLAALIEAGRALIEFVGATFNWAYSAVIRFVEAAFAVGFAIADLLETVVSETYWVLRRFVNGILVNLGPIGDILDFVLTQFENVATNLWRNTLLAIRFAQGNLIEALEWAQTQTAAAFEEIVRAWESIGENLIDIYEWALAVGNTAWRLIGEVTQNIGNSIYYVYNFLTTSGVEFIFDFTRGLLDAGLAVAGFFAWAVEQSVEIVGEILRAALDFGTTIGTMLIDIVQNPGNALNIFMQAMQDIGTTLGDLLEAVFVETAEEFMAEAIEALMEIGNALLDILEATLILGAAFLANLVAYLMSSLGTYRSLTANERADAQLVFGNSLDYDLIFLSNEDPLNAVVFGLQDFFTGNPNSRAFVAGNLINFDPSDNNFDRSTLIHELTHVWQYRTIGGIYMANAILAQGNAGYNYGYTDTPAVTIRIESDYSGNFTLTSARGSDMGFGGEAALIAQGGNLLAFNEEQQGQILMHWFVRTQLIVTDNAATPVPLVLSSAEWDPYQQFAFNS